MSALDVAELTDSSAFIDDAKTLQERFKTDGYVFARDLLDLKTVAWAKQQFEEKLVELQLIDPEDPEKKWNGTPADPNIGDTIGTKIWTRIIADAGLNKLTRSVLNARPFWIPIVRHRVTLPSGPEKPNEDMVEARHQDGFFNEGMDFSICWMPMMDVPRSRGGLAVAQGMHSSGYFHEHKPPYKIPAGLIPADVWRTADYRPGDVLLLSKSLPHVGLRNRTEQIRMSLDIRAIPEGRDRPIWGTVVELGGTHLVIRTDEGEQFGVDVHEKTFIRKMWGSSTVSLNELGEIAPVGARVLATADAQSRATLVRPLAY